MGLHARTVFVEHLPVRLHELVYPSRSNKARFEATAMSGRRLIVRFRNAVRMREVQLQTIFAVVDKILNDLRGNRNFLVGFVARGLLKCKHQTLI